ncbi:MAG: hypothetical protein ACRD6X_12540 [Pyrinomonadaceae bacterium]
MNRKLAVCCTLAANEVFQGETSTTDYKGNVPGHTRVPTKNELNKYFSAAGIPYSPGVHWCGIFQLWLLKSSGVACHWDRAIVDDSGGKDLEIVSGEEAKKGLAVGDIVRIGHAQHHFMILEPAAKGYLRNIEGNAGGIKYPMLAANWAVSMTRNVVEDIQFRYRVLG